MKEIAISADPFQSHIITYEDKKIELVVRFLVTVSMWQIDILVDDTYLVKGFSLSCGAIMLSQNNNPFGFYLEDTTPLGIDAFRIEDFAEGRVILYFLEREDMLAVRGYDVK